MTRRPKHASGKIHIARQLVICIGEPRRIEDTPTTRSATGNFISEWYGHRVYPVVATTSRSLVDQKQGRCPFLSDVTLENIACVKRPASSGVCTISSSSNGPRQDVDPTISPNAIALQRIIATDADSLADFATKVAPEVAIGGEHSAANLVFSIRQRLGRFWPVFAPPRRNRGRG